MRRVRLAAGALLVIGLIAVAVIGVRAPDPADRAVPLPLPDDRPLRIAVFGTSLTHDEVWTHELKASLENRFDRDIRLDVVAKPGAGSTWALEQVHQVLDLKPDWVLIEFAINDADIRDGLSVADARSTHEALLNTLVESLPNAETVLMTMSPAQGLRGMLRPRLAAHYRQYRDLADQFDIGLVDLHARWLAIPRASRGLQQDGLHPHPQVAANLIVPVLSRYLAQCAALARTGARD
ncbi:SGNH/GDSL hydrolase family protein [Phycobacter sp. K97]|uniref:SGNH/GDSL hydrolase family protein n=1 Tax=Phycobacter sedimenti TaxID=3133977 RepID=UPI00311E0AFF